MKVIVLGSTGMLGSALVSTLRPDIEVSALARDTVGDLTLPVMAGRIDQFLDTLGIADGDTVVNALGVVKGRIDESESESVLRALSINTVFARKLASYCAMQGARVITVLTDCVYSGQTGSYSEQAKHDATDVYGKTKSLGEVSGGLSTNIRASFLGTSLAKHRMLFDWFRELPNGSTVDGYTTHLWNGTTTFSLSRVIRSLIFEQPNLYGTFHLVPGYALSKYELLMKLRLATRREDVQVVPTEPDKVDRTLSTIHPSVSEQLWRASDGDVPDSIDYALEELFAKVLNV